MRRSAATWLALLIVAGMSPAARAASFEGLQFRASPARPENVAAFYEAREFPPPAIHALGEACFIGFSIRNQRREVVWLDLARWRFTDDRGQPVTRLTRAQWNERWERLGIAPAYRATFGWTQLPEARDLQPDEPVAGNVLVSPTDRPFRLEARFATGRDRLGPEIVVRVDNLKCHAPAGAAVP
jgi:hypothetical protein